MTLVAVAATKHEVGFPKKDFTIRHRVTPIEVALRRNYSTDAHLVAYIADGNPYPYQPRIRKAGLAEFFLPVRLTAFFVDVDNPGHGDWTPELFAAARAQWDTLPILRTAGVYHTAHGRRFVQPLAEPILVDRAEPYLRRYLFELEAAGLPVDWSCTDWTRHFRLPNVRRNGDDFRTPFMDLSRMQPIEVEPIEWTTPPEDAPGKRSTPSTPIVEPAWTATLPDVYRAHVDDLARAVRSGVTENWHTMYLALAGALVRRVPVEHVPELVRAVALAAGSKKPEGHTQGARDTVRRHLGGGKCTGFSELQRGWPAVAEALAAVTARGREARIRAQAAAPAEGHTLEQVAEGMKRIYRNPSDGLSLVGTGCGGGKTHNACLIAVERAKKTHRSPDATGTRAPAGSKTSISVDKNSLAIQVAEDLRAMGVPVRRVFGPLSVVDDEGKPVCRYHDVAAPLVAGGQSMQWEFCQGRGQRKCEHFDGCTARDGVEGPSDARITVGTHAMIGELDAAAGSTGLLFIDEPPAVLETKAITGDDLEAAVKCIERFQPDYATAMLPVLQAARAWNDPEVPFADVTDTLIVPTDLPKRPPIKAEHMFAARRSLSFANELGAASGVLGMLYRAMTSEVKLAVRLVERGRDGAKTIVVTAPREDFQLALRREGSVIVMDANAEIHVPVFAKIVGYEPPVHTFTAVDGAPIERTLLQCRHATRKSWFSHGLLVLESGVTHALRAVLRWAEGKLALITFPVVELAIRAALGEDVDAAWVKAHQKVEALEHVRAELGPMLREYKGTIVLGHYGGVRGLNTMADADCLATLGDPWPNLGEVEHDVAFLGVEDAWQPRLEALCRAEIEQAHGRLRTVHRTRPGRALHVGAVLPRGYGWTAGKMRIEKMPVGAPSTPRTMGAKELKEIVEKLGGVRSTARALGCVHGTVTRYLRGRGVPHATALELRRLASLVAPSTSKGGTETPVAELATISVKPGGGSETPIAGVPVSDRMGGSETPVIKNILSYRDSGSTQAVESVSGITLDSASELATMLVGNRFALPKTQTNVQASATSNMPSAKLRAAVMARLRGKPANDDLKASGS